MRRCCFNFEIIGVFLTVFFSLVNSDYYTVRKTRVTTTHIYKTERVQLRFNRAKMLGLELAGKLEYK